MLKALKMVDRPIFAHHDHEIMFLRVRLKQALGDAVLGSLEGLHQFCLFLLSKTKMIRARQLRPSWARFSQISIQTFLQQKIRMCRMPRHLVPICFGGVFQDTCHLRKRVLVPDTQMLQVPEVVKLVGSGLVAHGVAKDEHEIIDSVVCHVIFPCDASSHNF